MDMASRKLDIRFVQSLTAVQAIKAAQQFIQTFQLSAGGKIFTDAGSDFTSTRFAEFCQQHAINHYFNNPSSSHKTSILERAHRTIRAIAFRILHSKPEDVKAGIGKGKARLNMVEALREAVQIYNASFSSAIGMAPDDVETSNYGQVLAYRQTLGARKLDDYIERELRRRGTSLRTFQLPSMPQLPINALVRIQLQGRTQEEGPRRHAFSKEFASLTFSSQVYKVIGYKETSPLISYIVASIKDPTSPLPYSFTRSQLVLVTLP